ncbi:MAG TPA: hypothetical protein VGL72_07125 [Bryobacteraceae bacterium]
MELFKQIENKGNIFLELNSKFAANLSLAFCRSTLAKGRAECEGHTGDCYRAIDVFDA